MNRERISTTVDARRLAEARKLMGGHDSQIMDRALVALLEQLETEREVAALSAHPYEEDPDLAWEAGPGPDLPYDGEVPVDVLRLAKQRRRRPPER